MSRQLAPVLAAVIPGRGGGSVDRETLPRLPAAGQEQCQVPR
ncbi:hypothetical protein [Amycolatopsis methanolica]|nr:hypothetical protein [Amycolatopsis methanolica]